MMRNFHNLAIIMVFSFIIVLPLSMTKASEAGTALLKEYQLAAKQRLSAISGKALWVADSNTRSCTTCHSASVRASGKHQRTGKIIQPMSPSVNPERFTNQKKIKKWFLRNCKWTFGRECSAQEKGDILLWLSQQ